MVAGAGEVRIRPREIAAMAGSDRDSISSDRDLWRLQPVERSQPLAAELEREAIRPAP